MSDHQAAPSVRDKRQLSPVCAAASRALSFRLSRAPERCWTSDPGRKENELLSGPPLDHKPVKFGICDYQVKVLLLMFLDAVSEPSVVGMLTVWYSCFQAGSDFAQKNYSSGTRLLTTFSDGSAQLLYPLT